MRPLPSLAHPLSPDPSPMRRPALLLALALPLAACGGEPADDAVPDVTVRAFYIEPLFEGTAARVAHEAIEGGMPAMRMAIAADDPEQIAALTPGTKVELVLRAVDETTTGDRYRIASITELPASTELDLPEGLVPEVGE